MKIEDIVSGTYSYDDAGFLNVDGDVDLFHRGLKKIPFKFGVVSGSFKCGDNLLTSLEFCPVTVGGFFSCRSNLLKSLEFCPKEVGGFFNCSDNILKSLEGCPVAVGGMFNCSDKVGGDFDCSDNRLTSLKGCPVTVRGDFSCYGNQLTSLEFCPVAVGGFFDIDDTKEIRSLIRKHFKIKFKSRKADKMIEEYLSKSNAEKFILGI